MSLTEIIILAIALGVDCLVVSFSQGLILRKNCLTNSVILALTLGFCQGIMPIFGYAGCEVVSKFIAPYSSWLVFAIFLFLGIKFISEAYNHKEENVCCIHLKCLIGLGIATSIDALAAGVSLNLTHTSLLISCLIIGLASFYMSLKGFWFGIFFKKLPSKFLEIFGGLVLIFLAVKALKF